MVKDLDISRLGTRARISAHKFYSTLCWKFSQCNKTRKAKQKHTDCEKVRINYRYINDCLSENPKEATKKKQQQQNRKPPELINEFNKAMLSKRNI